MRPHGFATESYYHIYSRGVDRRDIFMDDRDRRRFLQSFVTLNNVRRPANIRLSQTYLPIEPYALVTAYCLMPNHFHLVLQQSTDAGISEFMQRWLNSYTKYFNHRHGRKGRLFESAYQSVPIEDDAQLLHATRYIHLNPLSIIEPGWKDIGIRYPEAALAYVRTYQWSSYRRYIGRSALKIITDRSVLAVMAPDEYRQFVEEYVKGVLTPGVRKVILAL